MHTKKTLEIRSNSPHQTEQVAEEIGTRLKGGEVIELVSDLGGGKTTFVRGLARGMGSDDRVASPTFTVSKVYQADERELHHFDFYRLHEAGVVAHELAEMTQDPHVVTVVEWGEIVADVLPPERLTVKISRTGDESRQLVLQYPENLEYLMEGVRI